MRRAIKIVAKLEATVGVYLKENVSLGVDSSVFCDKSIDWQLSPWYMASHNGKFVSIDPLKVAEMVAERKLKAESSRPAPEDWEDDYFEDV